MSLSEEPGHGPSNEFFGLLESARNLDRGLSNVRATVPLVARRRPRRHTRLPAVLHP